MVPLYTSEVFFLLHPFVFIDTGRASIILFLSRVLLNVAAITIWTWTSSMAGLVAGLICIAVSAFLWIVTGVVRRKMDTPKWLHTASYLSIVNWSIDLPGIKLILAGKPVSKIPTIIIIFVNIVAGALLAFIELAVEPLADAWGCYPPGSTLSDYKYGVCPKFHGHTEPTPVCDQPGVTCFHTDQPTPFGGNRAISTNLVGASLAIYLVAFRARRSELP